MSDLLTIKEFAELSGVEASTLRYWDEIGLFSPIMRNPENNYRYYSVPQLITLNFITVLSDLHISLKTISDLEKERDPEKFIKLIDTQENLLNMEMHKLRVSYAIIHARRELVTNGVKVDDAAVSVMFRENKPINIGPRNEYREGETFVEAIASLAQSAKDMHINLSFPVGAYHENIASFIEKPKRPEYFFSIDPTGNHSMETGDYLVGYARGYYGEFGDLPERMAAYAEENSINISGPVYTVYLLDEICMQDPSQYLAQSCVAVSK